MEFYEIEEEMAKWAEENKHLTPIFDKIVSGRFSVKLKECKAEFGLTDTEMLAEALRLGYFIGIKHPHIEDSIKR